jgi:hypothetical protein
MTEIVAQLRLGGRDDEHWHDIAVVAAARIEALEAALRKIAHPDNCLSWAEVERIACAALDKDAEK